MSVLELTPAFLASLENRCSGRTDLTCVPGSAAEAAFDFVSAARRGANVEWLRELAVRDTGDSAANVLVPTVAILSGGRAPYLVDMYVVSAPEDAMRVARAHVKKSMFYAQSFLGAGVLATPDLASWRVQREHLVPGLLPSVLREQVLPVVLERARYGVLQRLPTLADAAAVNMSDFLATEAMAQLHLGLFGEPSVSDQRNATLRDSFDVLLEGPGLHSRERVRDSYRCARQFSRDVLERSEARAAARCPVGPVGQLLGSNPVPAAVQLDTAITFSMAGFDTTGHLMEWCLLLLILHPAALARVRREVAALFAGEGPSFERLLNAAPFFSRCIAETLRLYPSVPNGTFRELSSDEWITGRNGQRVMVPKGSQVMIPSYLLHRSKALWGPTADVFDPERDFTESELFSSWSGTYSERYCPFTFPPRACLGMNFAQLEARVILAHLVHHYDVQLAEPTLSLVRNSGTPFWGSNHGTMGVRGGLHCHVTPRNAKL